MATILEQAEEGLSVSIREEANFGFFGAMTSTPREEALVVKLIKSPKVVIPLNEAEKESRVRFLSSMEKVKLSSRKGFSGLTSVTANLLVDRYSNASPKPIKQLEYLYSNALQSLLSGWGIYTPTPPKPKVPYPHTNILQQISQGTTDSSQSRKIVTKEEKNSL